MMGLGATITPKTTGAIQVTIAGDVNSSVIANGATIQISHGTGTAPTNGAALAGTQDGIKINYIASTAAGKSPFSVSAYVKPACWLEQHIGLISPSQQ
jgi:hypothetical protein